MQILTRNDKKINTIAPEQDITKAWKVKRITKKLYPNKQAYYLDCLKLGLITYQEYCRLEGERMYQVITGGSDGTL